MDYDFPSLKWYVDLPTVADECIGLPDTTFIRMTVMNIVRKIKHFDKNEKKDLPTSLMQTSSPADFICMKTSRRQKN